MSNQRQPMSDADLLSILRREENSCYLYQTAALSQSREDAMKYYDRDPMGDEQDGQSQIVTSEFADTIESMMPGAMEVFAGSETAVQFSPVFPGSEKAAMEASDYVPHVLMRQNEGFRILYWLIKDALMFRLSAVAIDLEPHEDRRVQSVHGLPQDAIDLIIAQAAKAENVELVMDLEEDPPAPMDGMADPGMGGALVPQDFPARTFSGTITATIQRPKVVVDNIAPEDILFSPTARDQDKASFLGFRKRVTGSDLREYGLSQDQVDGLRSDRPLLPEEFQRDPDAFLAAPTRDTVGDSERPFWIVQAYVRVDMDGDGISELMRVIYAHGNGGSAAEIIACDPWDGEAWMALASPILMSHVIAGRSIFDQTQDLQQIGTAVTRGMLTNLYFTNWPRPVVSDKVELDSLLDWVPGSPVRLKAGANLGEPHVQWLEVPTVLDKALQALEYNNSVRENRTGVTRNNQGLEGDSLNKTMGGMAMLMSASQQRQRLIARTLAETAIKRIYKLVYRAIKKGASGPVSYWAGTAFKSIDPSQWPDDIDLSVNIGAGTRDQAMMGLGQIAAAQEKLIALQGGQANGPFVTPDNVATLTERIANVLGFKTPGMFFQPPDAVARSLAAKEAQPQQPPQDPATMQAMAQIEILKQAAAADVETKRMKAQADIQIAWFKAQQDAEIAREKAGSKADLDTRNADHKAALKGMELAVDAHVDATAARHQPMPPGGMLQ